MHVITATFRNGHLELSEPVNWPDGMQVRDVPMMNDSDDNADLPAVMTRWPDGFLDEIREQWGDAPFGHPPLFDCESRVMEYLPHVMDKMRAGGASNASLKNRLRANADDRAAWTMNGLTPPWGLRLTKPLSKLPQFLRR